MQNNVTELTQRLLRALDTNYNVIDMPTVIEIVSLLEKVTITKELLETTRLGKHVNELRRKTDNDSLSKRAKELVKKWRNIFLPEPNGQLKSSQQQNTTHQNDNTTTTDYEKIRNKRTAKEPPDVSPSSTIINPKRSKINGQTSEFDFSDNSNSSFKDVISSMKSGNTPQKQQQQRCGGGGGGNNTNSDLILINSDSNSSIPDSSSNKSSILLQQQEPQLEQQLPKKRGRKKGSKNHKNLLDEAETSFTNKLAVSRGNTKVKTTQELIASLQNKNNTTPQIIGGNNNNNNSSSSSGGGGGNTTSSSSTTNTTSSSSSKTKEDLNVRAAKLTERVSIIDQKLNTNSNRSRKHAINKINLSNSSSSSNTERNNDNRIIESGSVINDKSLLLLSSSSSAHVNTDDEIIVVDDVDLNEQSTTSSPFMNNQINNNNNNNNKLETDDNVTEDAASKDDMTIKSNSNNEFIDDCNKIRSLSVEEALAQLPPIDYTVLDTDDDDSIINNPPCICVLKEVTDDDDLVKQQNNSDDDDDDINFDQFHHQHLQQQHQQQKRYEFIETADCPAKIHFDELLKKRSITPYELHTKFLENINGNYSLLSDNKITLMTDDGLYVNVVPNVNTEIIPKDFSPENYKKYSISKCEFSNNNSNSTNSVIIKNDNDDDDGDRVNVDDDHNDNDVDRTGPDNNNKNKEDNDETKNNKSGERIFREWHEVVDIPSYNGEVLKILPYVIID